MSDKKTARLIVEEGGLEFVTPGGEILAHLTPIPGGVIFGLGLPGSLGRITLTVSEDFAHISAWNHLGQNENGAEKCGTAATLAAGTNVQGQSGGEVRVKNSEGRTQVLLTTAPAGGHIGVMTADEVPVILAGVSPSGGEISVSQVSGHPAALMAAAPGGGLVSLVTEEGKPGVMLGSDQGDGGIACYDRNGAVVFGVPVWKMTKKKERQPEKNNSQEE